MKKSAILAGCAAMLFAFALPSVAEEGAVKVGGHMKGPVLTDNVWGKAMVNGVKSEGSYSAGSYFSTHAFQLYISKDITENVSVHAVPDFGSAGAGATPSLGKAMGGTLKTTSGATSFKFQELTASMNLTQLGLQLRAGYLTLPFTQDYGKELFWHEEHNGGKFTLASAWHDTGLEVYKAFEVGGVSLPSSLYIVNGNSSHNRDNNGGRAVMLHVEPEFGALKTFASYGMGKWGDNTMQANGTAATLSTHTNNTDTFNRWSAGAAYSYKAFRVRGEVAGGTYAKNIGYSNGTMFGNKDNFGYYGKLFYTIKPEKLTAMLHYNYYWVDVVNGSSNGIMQEKYDTTYLGLQYEMAPAATILVGYTNGNWRNNDIPTKKDYVKFQRFQTSVKVTF